MRSTPRGIVGFTGDLFVLDELLKIAGPDLEVWSGDKKWDREMLERIRFERGLDPRPRQPNRFALSREDQARIHEEAVTAVKEGKREQDNPYHWYSDEWEQWEHSFTEYKEACDNV